MVQLSINIWQSHLEVFNLGLLLRKPLCYESVVATYKIPCATMPLSRHAVALPALHFAKSYETATNVLLDGLVPAAPVERVRQEAPQVLAMERRIPPARRCRVSYGTIVSPCHQSLSLHVHGCSRVTASCYPLPRLPDTGVAIFPALPLFVMHTGGRANCNILAQPNP